MTTDLVGLRDRTSSSFGHFSGPLTQENSGPHHILGVAFEALCQPAAAWFVTNSPGGHHGLPDQEPAQLPGERAIKVIGQRWKAAILYHLFDRPGRSIRSE
jgi:hypothetical protein